MKILIVGEQNTGKSDLAKAIARYARFSDVVIHEECGNSESLKRSISRTKDDAIHIWEFQATQNEVAAMLEAGVRRLDQVINTINLKSK